MPPQMTKSKLLWVSESLDNLIKQAKEVSGLSESEIYRRGARRFAEELINNASTSRDAGDREGAGSSE
jgi:hypothetical protein